MKPILFSILFLLLPKLVISQNSINNTIDFSDNDRIIYLDSTQLETQSKDFKYFRIIKDYKLDKKSYVILEYYKSGIMKMVGKSKTKDAVLKEGEFIFYYDNGNKKSITSYSKGRVTGKDFEWYENGNKKLDGDYIEGNKKLETKLKINQFWNSKNIQTVIDGNGNYEEIKEGYFASGKIKNGFKDSIWVGEDKKIKFTYTENYTNGELISGVSIDSNNTEHKYTESEIRPIPKKGMDDFNRHVARTFKCPKVEGLRGKIYVTFVVETDGSISDVKVLRDIGYGSGAEAIRAVSSYKGWIPGELRGIKVRCKFSLPITVQSTR